MSLIRFCVARHFLSHSQLDWIYTHFFCWTVSIKVAKVKTKRKPKMQAVADGRKADPSVSWYKTFLLWTNACVCLSQLINPMGLQNFLQLAYELEKSLQNVEVRTNRKKNCWYLGNMSSIKTIILPSNSQQNDLMYGEEGTCTLCSKTFARKSSLLTHIRNHTAERKYQCPTCQKSKRRFNCVAAN